MVTGSYVLNGVTYEFDENGKCLTFEAIADRNIVNSEGEALSSKVYVKADGSIAKGEWVRVDNAWYYFSIADGAMVTGTRTIRGIKYELGEDGAVEIEAGKTYTIDENGALIIK